MNTTSHVIEGRWWLASNPENKLAGKLTYSYGRRAELELSGLFSSFMGCQIPTVPVIHGESYDGAKITLTDSHIHQYTPDHLDQKSTIGASNVFVGAWLLENELEFSSIAVTVKNLEYWVWKSGVNAPWPKPGAARRISYKTPEPKIILENESGSVSIIHGYRIPFLRFGFEIKESVHLRFNFNQPRQLVEAMGYARHILQFIALAMDMPMQVLGVSAIVPSMAPNERLTLSTDMYSNPEVEEWKEVDGRLLLLPDVRTCRRVLKKWSSDRPDLEPILGSRSALRTQPDLFYETKILFLTNALETLHRKFFGTSYCSSEVFNSTIYPRITIPDDIDKDHRQAIKQRLKFAYEYSLRKRLCALISSMPDDLVRDFISRKPKQFVDRVTELRNYYTHYDGNPGVDHSAPATFLVPVRLLLMLDYHLLVVAGLTAELAQQCVADHYREVRIANGASWEF